MTGRMRNQEKLPRVADFFRGKDLLITGASGFVGRTLIEKLLREAPEIGTIFLLLRAKRGCAPRDRLHSITNVKLFHKLRAQQPHALDKLHVVAGDMKEPGLGLSAEDAAMLCQRVHVVFHGAASVRFDEPLKNAMLLNCRGTRELCELAKGMSKLEGFIHISTAFCNMHKQVNDEEISPPVGDWRAMIEVAETNDDFTLRTLTNKIIGRHANTYVYTKSLAEQVIVSYKEELPVAIIRPSMVLPAFREPFGGWIDNLYGPMGIAMAGMAGLFSVNIQTADDVVESIPIDVFINGLVLLTVQRGVMKQNGVLPVVNGTMCHKVLWNFGDGKKFFPIFQHDNPVIPMYKHFILSVNSELMFYILFMLTNVSISSFYDFLLRFKGLKKRTLYVHRKLLISCFSFLPFIKSKLSFPNHNFKKLYELVAPEDKIPFEINMEVIPELPYQLRSISELRKLHPELICSNPARTFIILEIVHYIFVCLILWNIWKWKLPSLIANVLLGIVKFTTMLPL